MLLKYAEMLAIFVHENMKLGDNWLEDVSFKHVIIDQKLAFRIILLPSNINVLETQSDLKQSSISNFKKNLLGKFKIFGFFVKVAMISKLSKRAPWYML